MIAREPVELAYQHYQAAQERIQDESAQAWEVDLAHLQEMVDRWGLLAVVGALFRDFEVELAGLPPGGVKGRRQVSPLSEVGSDEF
ncbi:MAG: hypothetical protein ACKO63_18480 [Nodosilinea sp.]